MRDRGIESRERYKRSRFIGKVLILSYPISVPGSYSACMPILSLTAPSVWAPEHNRGIESRERYRGLAL